LETSTLRWILIIIGVVIIASIFLFGNPDKKRQPKASRRSEKPARGRRKKGASKRLEPTLDGGEEGSPAAAEPGFSEEPGGQGELDIGAAEATPAKEPPRPAKPAGPPPDKIISLFLLARDNRVINGAELLQATVSTGMEFGDMNIFHRVHEGTEQPVFSLANAAKPGHFERDEWNTFETSGVVLFMTLPGPTHALDCWDAMLATARRIGEILHAELLDQDRSPFTRQREAQIREEMREYDRRKSRQD
jgi:cell division protein ZipA